MPRHHLALCFALLATTLTAQGAEADKPIDPVSLVSRGEQLLKKGEKEDGMLLLWQALDALAALPSNTVRETTRLSARYLLEQNDTIEAERRRVMAAIAKRQLELAQGYRVKKWFDSAATRVDVAQRYDPDAAGKERALIAAARPKDKPEPKPVIKTGPGPAKVSPLLQKAHAEWADGPWREVDDRLEVAAHNNGDELQEWVCKATQGDNEVVTEIRPMDPSKAWNAAIGVGLHIASGTANYSGLRCYCQFFPATKDISLLIWRIDGMDAKLLGNVYVKLVPVADDFHRLAVRVNGSRVRLQVDAEAALEIDAGAPVTGMVGLLHGLSDSPSCAVQFRNFRVDPLPADMPSDDALRQQAEAQRQSAITTGVEQAKDLLQKKQPEAASLQLRDVLEKLADMPEGILRDNLQKSIEQMLTQADPMAAKRKKAAQAIAVDLIGLADTYAFDGRARLAQALVRDAARFDPEGAAARLATAEQAVQQWNLQQATARANELAPPTDDGAVLRDWFEGGRRLDSRQQEWVVEGLGARLDNLPNNEGSSLLPKAGTPALGKASVYVHLPKFSTDAGYCFNVAGPHDYSICTLSRGKLGLMLIAYRYVNGRWTELARNAVMMDAWRLDGWFEISIEATPTGITVQGAGAKVVLEQQRLGPATGRFGLYGSNTAKEPVTIEWRAFKVPK